MRDQVRRRHDQSDAATESFEKLAPVEIEVIEGLVEKLVSFEFDSLAVEIVFQLVHSATSFAVPAAISIALTIRA